MAYCKIACAVLVVASPAALGMSQKKEVPDFTHEMLAGLEDLKDAAIYGHGHGKVFNSDSMKGLNGVSARVGYGLIGATRAAFEKFATSPEAAKMMMVAKDLNVGTGTSATRNLRGPSTLQAPQLLTKQKLGAEYDIGIGGDEASNVSIHFDKGCTQAAGHTKCTFRLSDTAKYHMTGSLKMDIQAGDKWIIDWSTGLDGIPPFLREKLPTMPAMHSQCPACGGNCTINLKDMLPGMDLRALMGMPPVANQSNVQAAQIEPDFVSFPMDECPVKIDLPFDTQDLPVQPVSMGSEKSPDMLQMILSSTHLNINMAVTLMRRDGTTALSYTTNAKLGIV